MPKNRHFNLNYENPLSDSYLQRGLGSPRSESSDTLQQFFGYETPSDEELGENGETTNQKGENGEKGEKEPIVNKS